MMRYFVTILVLTLFASQLKAQSNHYTDRWKKIDTLILRDGKNASAVEEIKTLYTLAKKEKQDAQMIRALAYLFSVNQELKENAAADNIDQLLKEIKAAHEPLKQLLYALLAKQYLDYTFANQFKRWGQTPTDTEENEKISSWSIPTLHKKIRESFQQALQNPQRLQSINIETWPAIILKKDNASKRPTLYDLIAFEAIDYYDEAERNMPYQKNSFTLTNEALFAEASAFTEQKITTSDSSSVCYQAIVLFQDIIRFHLHDVQKNALIDADVKRYDFLYEHSDIPNKKILYQDRLQHLSTSYPNEASAAIATVKLLTFQKEIAEENWKYVKDPTEKFTLAKIAQEARIIQERFPQTPAANLAFNLQAAIEAPGLSAKTELVVIPGQPFLSLVTYKNTPTVHYRIIKLNQIMYPDYLNRDNIWKHVLKQKPFREIKQTLPLVNDHREHSVEIKIDGLDKGYYALLASVRNDFALADNEMSLQFFQVSRISIIHQKNNYFILDRETGKPLVNAELQWMESERSGMNTTEPTLIATRYSNSSGFVKQPSFNNNWNVALKINWQKDTLHPHLLYPYHHYSRHHPNQLNTVILTDRSIYRPGQTIYFKGIVMQVDGSGNDHQLIAHQPTEIALLDANGQQKATVPVTTNAFGSYHGQFIIPEGMTGRYSLRDQRFNGYETISIEEYKRPSFEIVWDKSNELKKIGDSITARGSIKAYAGQQLNNSKLKYRITRFPDYALRWNASLAAIAPAEIANGETVTNEEGQFAIPFSALAPPHSNGNIGLVFMIQVEATDLSGETHASTKSFRLNTYPIKLVVELDKKEYNLSDLNIPIKVLNYDQQDQDLPITVRLTALTSPKRLLKPRYWNAPDTAIYTVKEFNRYFPNDPYLQEDDPSTWPRLNRIMDKTIKPGMLRIEASISTGHYLLEIIAQTPKGDSIKEQKIVKINTPIQELESPYFYSNGTHSTTAEPGQIIPVSMRSSLPDMYLMKQIDRMQNELDSAYAVMHITDGAFSEPISVTEKDRGGIAIHHAFVKYNRVFSYTTEIKVPWTNKELNIDVETFRDKLLPGAKETLTVNISGKKGEKLAAEMLSSMYDASLDQFEEHVWRFPDLYKELYSEAYSGASNFQASQEQMIHIYVLPTKSVQLFYDRFIWSDQSYLSKLSKRQTTDRMVDVAEEDRMYQRSPRVMMMTSNQPLNEIVQTNITLRGKTTIKDEKPAIIPTTQIRKNFSETAFFFPQLHTDKEGKIRFSFTLPEALTRWKWQMLAHTQDLASGYAMKEIISQKPLMISAQMPRFLREGDHIKLAARVTNLSDKELSGMALLQLIDPEKNQPVDGWFQNIFPSQYFTIEAGRSAAVFFDIQVPFNVNKPVQYRLSAKAGTFTDGEENMLPVLSQRQLITESMPLLVKNNQPKTVEFFALKNASSTTLSHRSLTVEYTPNPAWQAVLALPYLMEYPYECAEQSFNRYYAHALASRMVQQSPMIKKIVMQWSQSDTAVFLSQLMKNPELKSVLLEQTPWVFDAENETAQRKKIAQLFDQLRISKELQSALNRVQKLQTASGGFSWFDGGVEDRYITQYILTGLARLKKLNAIPEDTKALAETIAKGAIGYIDEQIRMDLVALKKEKQDLSKDHLGPFQIQYLYVRAQFAQPIPDSTKQAYQYYLNQAKQYWLSKGLMQKGMLTAVMLKNGQKELAMKIITSLEQHSITHENLGMYWKNNTVSMYWYHAPIETQAILIEAFHAVGKKAAVEQMKFWLLNQKRVQQWPSTISTADAIYAILLTGKELIASTPKISIQVGKTAITGTPEAGSGYIKQTIPGEKVTADMGNITIKPDVSTTNASWGAVHWQYLEDMDKIKPAETTVSLKRQFYIQRNTDHGVQLKQLAEGSALHIGDKLVVRILLTVDRDMEYMHLKDMRPSSTEPVNVRSGYRYNNGLGYYESTRDASTDFFISWLPKGSWVFEYPLFVTHSGRFSAGIATIQSMYAPEFNAHSAGFKVDVEGNGN